MNNQMCCVSGFFIEYQCSSNEFPLSINNNKLNLYSELLQQFNEFLKILISQIFEWLS